MLDTLYKISFFDVTSQQNCKEMLIKATEETITQDNDETIESEIIPPTDENNPYERFLRWNSREVEKSREGEAAASSSNEEFQSSTKICIPPVLDEKIRALSV